MGCGRRPRGMIAAAVGLAMVALLAACGSSGAGNTPSVSATTSGVGGAQAAFPVTIQDCGQTLSFPSPPQRVVILNPAVADALIEMGVEDRLVAQSGTDIAPTLPQYRDVMQRVPVLSSGRLTGTEALLGAKPDLIISDLAYRLDPNAGGASLQQLQTAGIRTYIAAGGCANSAGTGKVADIFTDIDNFGKIFGVSDKAKNLASTLHAKLADTEHHIASKPKVPVFEFATISGQFYTVGGVELDALNQSGGVSVFPDVNSQNPVVSPEVISARNPQAFIEVTFPGRLDSLTPNNQQKEIDSLKKTFPTTDAVRNGRIYFLDAEAAGVAGSIRVVDGIVSRAKLLHPDAF